MIFKWLHATSEIEMKDRLFIRLLPDHESVEWGLINSQEATTNFLERGNLLLNDIVALADMAEELPVTVLIPAEKIRSFKVNAPTKNRKQLQKAVPYLLEELVIESVETQHFALGEIDGDNQLSINVISKAYLSDLLDRFKNAGVEPDELIPDAASLPVFEDAWSMLDSDPALVRQDNDTFWSAPQDMAKDLLQWNLNQAIEEEQSISQALRVFSDKETPINLNSVAGLAVQPMPIEDELLWLASQDRSNGINLLQQDFSPTKKSNNTIGVWRLPLIAASVLAVVGLSYLVSDIIVLKSERDAYQNQALQEVRKISPNIDEQKLDSKINEIGRLYKKAAGSTGQVAGLTSLLDKVYTTIDPAQLRLEQIDYNSKQGTLNLDVIADNYQQLTSTQERLEANGLKAEMRNAKDNGGSWTTRLVVKVN
ncbi:general secretion pathway protein GspL [Kangiella sp. HZ709]|nr:general secretion pathway protein GspL [Kangiella sp. HZ709]